MPLLLIVDFLAGNLLECETSLSAVPPLPDTLVSAVLHPLADKLDIIINHTEDGELAACSLGANLAVRKRYSLALHCLRSERALAVVNLHTIQI